MKKIKEAVINADPCMKGLIVVMIAYVGIVATTLNTGAANQIRGELNEPANVVYIAQEIAKLKNMEIENVASKTTFNAKTIFGIK